MLYILALMIVIGFACWLLSKMFNKVGNFLEKLGEALADRSISQTRSKPTKHYTEKIKEKIRAIKGKDTDEEYMKKVRSDIDKLTEE